MSTILYTHTLQLEDKGNFINIPLDIVAQCADPTVFLGAHEMFKFILNQKDTINIISMDIK